jgi:hypothetical protein
MKRFFILIGFLLPLQIQAARGPSDPYPAGFIVFPSNNIWNTPINNLPVSSSNTYYMSNMQVGHSLIPIFGQALFAGSYNGIPYNMMCASTTPNAPVTWAAGAYISESDTLPVAGLPIPVDAIVEGDPAPLNPANDNHLILIDTCTNVGYEIFQASRVFSGASWNGSWTIMQLSTWSYTSNYIRPDGFTSANAAGTSMLPEVVNWNEVNTGAIHHAMGFTIAFTHSPHIWPARHDADTGSAGVPPFGTRMRLKSSFDISGYSATNQIILQALKTYGMILIDNGPSFDLAGAPNSNWNDTDLHNLENVIGSNFEIVDTSSLQISTSSAQAIQVTSSNTNALINGNATVKGNTIFY